MEHKNTKQQFKQKGKGIMPRALLPPPPTSSLSWKTASGHSNCLFVSFWKQKPTSERALELLQPSKGVKPVAFFTAAIMSEGW